MAEKKRAMVNEHQCAKILDSLRLREPHVLSIAISTMADGSLFYTVYPPATDEVQAITLSITVDDRGRYDPAADLRSTIALTALNLVVRLHEDRFYLLPRSVPNEEIRRMLDTVRWLRPKHPMAAMRLEEPSEERASWRARIIFHRDYLSVQELIRQATLQVVRLGVKESDRSIGSAFVLAVEGHHRILTAKHVVSATGQRLRLRGADGSSIPVTATALSTIHDGAELTADAPLSLHPLSVGDPELSEVDDRVFVCGYPSQLDAQPTLCRGYISKINATYKSEAGLIQIAGAAVNPSNSGGPITGSAGDVIGILTTKALKADLHAISFGEPIDRVLRALGSPEKGIVRGD